MAKRKADKPIKVRQMSPIEIQMRNAIVNRADPEGVAIHDTSCGFGQPSISFEEGRIFDFDDGSVDVDERLSDYGDSDAADTWRLMGNVFLDAYRVDFLLGTYGSTAIMAIECDGHDWHERTKQQASSDRARDRALLRMGVTTIRFTGSDIYHRANDCAAEVFSTYRSLLAAIANEEMAPYQNGYAVGRVDGLEQGIVRTRAERKCVGIFEGVLSGVA